MMSPGISLSTNAPQSGVSEKEAWARFDRRTPNAALRLTFRLPCPDPDFYLLLPACAYNGNRFRSFPRPYCPKFTPEEACVDMPLTISDVPRLEEDGSGVIEVSTADLSVPCVGYYIPSLKQGVLLFTVQGDACGNFGITCRREGDSFTVAFSAPLDRERAYRFPQLTLLPGEDPSRTAEAGECLSIPYRVHAFSAADIPAFLEVFLRERKCLYPAGQPVTDLPHAAAFAIQEEKFNRLNWNDTLGFYRVGIDVHTPSQVWQPGWVGGGISTLPFLIAGNALSRARSLQTLQFLCSTQSAAGFFSGIIGEDGTRWGEDHRSQVRRDFVSNEITKSGAEDHRSQVRRDWHLVRKSADVLYFGLRQLRLLRQRGETVPQQLPGVLRRTADAFVRLWEQYGQFGQFVREGTGEILVGGSTAGAIAPGALAMAAEYFGSPLYLKVAREAAHDYATRYTARGYTVGGPGDMLQCPDSESAFALLESFVLLYAATHEACWLEYAKRQAALCATWVVAYDFSFPQTSLFGKLGIRTTGSVFANVQNKHAAPGLCTLSGMALLMLYRYTGDPVYAQLLSDISRFISQCLCREDKPFFSWDASPRRLENGAMSERVNMSDWEGADKVGGVFYGSCWCETSLLLSATELPGVYVDTGRGRVFTFDHVDALYRAGVLTLHNPTAYDTVYTVFPDDGTEADADLLCGRYLSVAIKAGQTRSLTVSGEAPDGTAIESQDS